MELEIFSAGDRQCALLSAGGRHVMIDCASKSAGGISPGDLLCERGIRELDLLVITSLKEERVSGLPNLLEKVTPRRLYRNMQVAPESIGNLTRLQTGDGVAALDYLTKVVASHNEPALAIPDVQVTTFSLSERVVEDPNDLSLVTALNMAGHMFLFGGVMSWQGWHSLLRANRPLRSLLPGVTVYVASDQGRLEGIYEDIFDRLECTPRLVVLGEDAHGEDSLSTADYYAANAVGGLPFRGVQRKVLISDQDGPLTFTAMQDGEAGWNLSVN